LSSTVVLPEAGCGSYGESNPALIAVQAALSQQNKPYIFGSKANPLVGDGGAGFTKWAWAKAGVTLPATVAGQFSFGKVVPEAAASVKDFESRIKGLKPGDLLYWESSGTSPPRLTHVAMYVGNGSIIDSYPLSSLISVKPIPWSYQGLQYKGTTRPPIPNNATNIKDGWVMPVKNPQVTSPFGMRFHPTQHVWMLHDGVDFRAPLGTPIFAAHDGVIVAPFGTGFGNQIILDHGSSVLTGYAHMSKFAPDMTIGKKVKAGDLIGYAGSTGWSTGSHLHFRILIDRKAVDPIVYLRQFGLVP
jgi:murein DD-endopeptidase MepM/ murein hydrolase activator NlpD